jgi:hypothetical protein
MHNTYFIRGCDAGLSCPCLDVWPFAGYPHCPSGTTSGSFTTLKGAFDKINYGTHKGDSVI